MWSAFHPRNFAIDEPTVWCKVLPCQGWNRCDKMVTVTTTTDCHSCLISAQVNCPAGFKKRSSGQGDPNCKYQVNMLPDRALTISGCSHQCYKEVLEPHCCPGFWGTDCIECPENAQNPCSNNGVCSDGQSGNGTCNLCNCVHGICNSGIQGNGQCTCFSGYKGLRCDQELPECATLQCSQNARCTEDALTGTLQCRCLPGYQGNGVQCTSINPCLKKVCHANAACAHLGPNRHSCTCNAGYSGDGVVCMAVDPCQTNFGGCSTESARCVYDGPGKSHCVCLDGYDSLEAGVRCSLKDLCTPSTCSVNAVCATTGPGLTQCTCQKGYIGNGKICYGNIIQRLQQLNTEPNGPWVGQLSNAITLFKASMSWALSSLGPFTVFVPNDKAFKGTSVKNLIADQMNARYLSKLHVVAGELSFETLKKGNIYYTLTGKSGETVTTDEDGQIKIRIHGSRKKGGIVQSDVIASNGVIHIINKVMDSVAPTVQSEKDKANLGNLLDNPGPYTVFAPTNTALDAMNQADLDYLNTDQGKTKLLELLRNHVIQSVALEVVNIVSNPRSVTMANQVLTFNVTSNDTFSKGCVFRDTSLGPSIPTYGCSLHCNQTVTTPLCCKGFYGADCSPCPGGFTTPCSGRGQGSRCQYCSSPNKYGPGCDKTCPCIHGECDNRPDSDGSCKPDTCMNEYTGKFCERHTKACGPRVQFCHAHASCDFNGGAVRCICKPGFQGDGITCVETDPCSTPLRGGCSVNAKCIKTGPGTHTCQCLRGWRADGDDCQAINNCLESDNGGCHANATCIYIGPGQSDCECKNGFRGNGKDCEAINQCVEQNGGCHYLATCQYLNPGAWKCVCQPGYTGDGQVCYGTVAQELSALPEGAEFYKWVNDAGISTLLSTTTNLTLLIPSSSAVTSMTKDDKSYWTTRGSALATIIKYHMIMGVNQLADLRNTSTQLITNFLKTTLPVSTTTESTIIGGATIISSDIAATNGLVHVINKVLIPDRKLNEGLLELLNQRPECSLFRSALIQYNLTQLIDKYAYYTVFAPSDSAVQAYLRKTGFALLDANTTRLHVILKEKLMKRDLREGVYKETMAGFQYQVAFFLRSGKGYCLDCFTTKNPCPVGMKVMGRKRGRCLYRRVLQGESIPTFGCRMMCKNSTIVRQCCKGHYGKNCERCPGPVGQPCFGNGICQDGTNGTGTCQCNKGFDGTACETCQAGKYSVHCDQDCKCVHGQCREGILGDGTCDCEVGWRGVYCDQAIIQDICNGKCHSSANCVVQGDGSSFCRCANGFEGNGTFCLAKDACEVNNGGCSPKATCKKTGPGRRQCVCPTGYSGDGLVCVEINPCLTGNGGCNKNAQCVHTGPNKELFLHKNRSIRELSFAIARAKITDLRGRGPFTVFAPPVSVINQNMTLWKTKGVLADILRYHFVSCQTLLPEDLTKPKNLTTLQGETLSITYSEDTIIINGKARVVSSDTVSANGIIHVIDSVLVPDSVQAILKTPPDQVYTTPNLTDLAKVHSYSTFTKLLEDTNVMSLVTDHIHQPVTLFLPTDRAMAALPQQQKDFLYSLQNRAQLQEYLKYHIIRDAKVYAATLLYHPLRTLQGSHLTMKCGGDDSIGKLFLNNRKCQILERQIEFNGGIAHGIDCLLTPPSLGGRCDTIETLPVNELKKCTPGLINAPKMSGCQSMCTAVFWKSKCCPGYYGRDCLACPGGPESTCSSHGKCDEGHLGTGNCTCDPGFKGVACELCIPGYFGPSCKACNCTEHGSCDEGVKGTGACFCDQGWTGPRCESPLAVDPVCSPSCSSNAVCKENNTCECKPFYEGDGLTCTCKACQHLHSHVFSHAYLKQLSSRDVISFSLTPPLPPSTPVADLCQQQNGGCAMGAKCTQNGVTVTCTCPKGHSGDGYICLPIDPCAAQDNGGCHEHATCTMTGPDKKKCECKTGYIGDGVTCEERELPINRCSQVNGQCHSDAQCTDLHFEDKKVGVFHLRSPLGQYKLNYTQALEGCTSEGGTLATYTQLSYAQEAGFNMCAAGWLDQMRVAYPTTYPNPKCGFGHVGIVDYGTRVNLKETWDAFCYRMKDVQCTCKPGYIGDGYECSGNLLQVLTAQPTFSMFLSTLSDRDIEYHLLDGSALYFANLTNGSKIRTRLGHSLQVMGIADFHNASVLYHVAHKAGMGMGILVVVLLLGVAAFGGYHFYSHRAKPFQFHYFRDEDGDYGSPVEPAPALDTNPSICNPVYDSSGSAPIIPSSPSCPTYVAFSEGDQNCLVENGPFDMYQDS
ncbi:hypothetical protein JZ751_022242 [Albula glossodonta]|uniref:Stabilin 2 n=1 Tax=Albula glossodonta TaxID=121402 RepID=A0A8T2NI38_9TELE|nr:hypothetical protein JZ751_022242 [Albula glossodonta]